MANLTDELGNDLTDETGSILTDDEITPPTPPSPGPIGLASAEW